MIHKKTVQLLGIILLCISTTVSCQKHLDTTVQLSKQTTFHLIASLSDSRVDQLYYDESKFPWSVKELIVKSGIFHELQTAYQEFEDDELARFNIIVILNHKKARSKLEKEILEQTLLTASLDESDWIRTEAIWGMGLLSDVVAVPFIIPALDDPVPMVVNEAILAMYKVTSEEDLPISNESMTDEEREKQVIHWKKWWHENKYRWGM